MCEESRVTSQDMKRMNLIVFAVVLTTKSLKCFGGPTDLLLNGSRQYTERDSSYHTDKPEEIQDQQALKEVEDADLGLIQLETKIPPVEIHQRDLSAASEKPQQSLPTEPKVTATRATEHVEVGSSEIFAFAQDRSCDNCGRPNDSRTVNDSKAADGTRTEDNVDEEALQRIEIFKQRILKKLKLKQPPIITHPKKDLPQQFFQIQQNHHNNRHHHILPDAKKSSSKVYFLADEGKLYLIYF